MQHENGKIIIAPDELQQKILEILMKYGVKQKDAKIVADTIVEAEMRGVKSHGINMLPAYLRRIKDGGINIKVEPTIIKEKDFITLIDANGGFGQVAGEMATKIAIEKARKYSLSWIGVRNSNHCGMLAYYTEKIAHAGLIGIMLVNANPTVAPYGGMEAVLGTNPISVSIPTKNIPIILDIATSSVAKAKIYRAKELNEKINPEWAIDENGYPTDDPSKAINGVLTPLGGPKGFGLAIIVDVIAGILNNSGFSHYVTSVHKDTTKSQNAGLTIISVSLESFLELETYYQKVNELINLIKASKPRPGFDTIYLPGEIEAMNREKAIKKGLEIDENILNAAFESK